MNIDNNSLTKTELEYIRLLGRTPTEAIKSMISLLKERSKDARPATVTRYISDRLYRTGDHSGKVSFKRAYEDYLEYCATMGSQVVTKKEFSNILESCGIPRRVIGGNRNVFMFVEFKTNEDEEWEL